MLEALNWVIVYFYLLLVGILNALWLNPKVLEIVEQVPESGWVVGGIVFLAGASTLLGESAVLFVNRVRRGRFIISLITNGIVFLISYFVWAVTINVIGSLLFSVHPPFSQTVRMVGLSTAPFVFGFFILIPWMGPFIAKVLNIWSLVILIVIVEFEFKIGFWPAALCVALGWLVSLAFTNTIGRPVVALRNKVFRMVSGSKLDSTTEGMLLRFSGASYDELMDQAAELIDGLSPEPAPDPVSTLAGAPALPAAEEGAR